MGQRKFDQLLYEKYIKANLDLALKAPEIQANPSLRYWPDIDDYTMSAGMAITPRGRIWLTYFGGEDNDEAVMLLCSSDDNGKTFTKPQFLIDAGYIDFSTHLSTVVGTIWCDPLGRLWWFFTLSLGYFDGRAGNWAVICDNPDADQIVWNKPFRIGDGCMLNKPLVTSDNTWLLPMYLWGRDKIGIQVSEGYWLGKDSSLFPELDDERKTYLYASTDQGKTWTRRGGVVPLEGRTFDEPMVVERADKSLFMLMRTDKEGMVATESFDQGRIWSTPVPFRQPNPSARHFLTKLDSGNLLLVHHNPPENKMQRSHLTAWISTDGGKNWQGGLLLDERNGVSYPDGFQAGDGLIYVQHDYKRRHGELVLSVFCEEDVIAGKNVSGQVKLKHSMVKSYSMEYPFDA